MDMPLYQEAIAHYLAGIALSFGDRLFSKNAKRHTKERLDMKLSQAEALQYLAENQEDGSPEYTKNIMLARDYFRSIGKKVKIDRRSLVDRVTDCYKSEKLNNLSASRKLAAAFGIEFVADACVAVAQIMGGAVNALTALGESLVQGPALFLGLYTGKGLLYVKDAFRTSDEKEIDSVLKELTADGKLYELINEYSATKHVEAKIIPESKEGEDKEIETEEKKQLPPGDSTAEKVGDAIYSAGEKVGSAVGDAIGRIRQKMAEKGQKEKDADKARAEELKSRYDKY